MVAAIEVRSMPTLGGLQPTHIFRWVTAVKQKEVIWMLVSLEMTVEVGELFHCREYLEHNRERDLCLA